MDIIVAIMHEKLLIIGTITSGKTTTSLKQLYGAMKASQLTAWMTEIPLFMMGKHFALFQCII